VALSAFETASPASPARSKRPFSPSPAVADDVAETVASIKAAVAAEIGVDAVADMGETTRPHECSAAAVATRTATAEAADDIPATLLTPCATLDQREAAAPCCTNRAAFVAPVASHANSVASKERALSAVAVAPAAPETVAHVEQGMSFAAATRIDRPKPTAEVRDAIDCVVPETNFGGRRTINEAALSQRRAAIMAKKASVEASAPCGSTEPKA